MMRIITGSLKGKKLETLQGDLTRPTSERVKEAIFSALQFDLEGRRVLDLFAGCGQMGLEALSRGAKSVMFIDASQDAMAVVKRNVQSAGVSDACRFLVSDYRNYIRKATRADASLAYDLVFIDPPYAMNAQTDALRRLVDAGLLAPYATAVLECAAADPFAEDTALSLCFDGVRTKKYGPTYVHIMTFTGKKDAEDA